MYMCVCNPFELEEEQESVFAEDDKEALGHVYICMYMHVYVYIYMYIYLYIYIYIYIKRGGIGPYIYIYTYICMRIYTCPMASWSSSMRVDSIYI